MSVLDEGQRAALSELADVLVPGDESMPSASQVGLAGSLVDRVLAVRPTAAAALPALLDSMAAAVVSPRERLLRLRSDDPDAFTLLSSVVVGAYFLDGTVRSAIAYPGQGPSEVTFADETGYIADGLLDLVLEREPRTASG